MTRALPLMIAVWLDQNSEKVSGKSDFSLDRSVLSPFPLFLSHQLFVFFHYIHLHTKKRPNGICQECVAFSRQPSGNEAGATSLRPGHAGKRENHIPHCGLCPSPRLQTLWVKKDSARKGNESMKASHLQKEGINMMSFCDFKACGPHRPLPEGLFLERTAGVLTSATY